MLRVGLVGLGHMGKLHFMNALRLKGIGVAAAADKSEKNRKFAEKYHVRAYDDYKSLIDTEKLDAVIISLPNFLKKESVLYAAENKLDIFLDKPMSRNLAEAQEIVRKVEKENVRLMVGVNYRYYDSVQKLKSTLDDGKVGDIVIATSDLILNGPFSHPLVPAPVPDWWLHKETAGGGALMDLGYHLIDLFSWMFGQLDVNYSNLGHRLNLPLDDVGTVILESENGTTCIANFGWFQKSIFPDFNFRFTVHGVAGYDSTDRYAPRNLRSHAVKEGTLNLLRRLSMRKIHYLSYTYYYASFFWILELFFEMVRQGTESPVSLKQQLEVLRIIDSVYAQHGVN